jgi:uncharacterized membrane protein
VTLLTLDFVFVAGGCVLAAVGGLIAADAAHPKRWGSAAFWLLLALAIGAGKWLSPAVVPVPAARKAMPQLPTSVLSSVTFQ